MRSMMLEMIAGDAPVTDALRNEVDAYIDASTGIQTIFQMQMALRVYQRAWDEERHAG